MENKIKISIFVFLSVLSLGLAQQNLCNDAKELGYDFAPDPSHCTRYLYCLRDANNTDDETNIISVYYGQCDQTIPQKYFKDGRCISDPTHCVNAIDICPGGAASKVKIGNHNVNDCNDFRYCALPAQSWSKCLATPGESWQFDRNTGTCVDNTGGSFLPDCPFEPPATTLDPNAPTTTTTAAPPGPPTADCTDNQEGYVASNTTLCDEWVFCFGEQVWDSGRCPCGSSFNSANPPCQEDATCFSYFCPEPTTTTATTTQDPTATTDTSPST